MNKYHPNQPSALKAHQKVEMLKHQLHTQHLNLFGEELDSDDPITDGIYDLFNLNVNNAYRLDTPIVFNTNV